MQHQRRKRFVLDSGSNLPKPDRFAPLLADIQRKLGESWMFYEECMNGVLDAAANQRDTVAWLEQMQQLIDRNDTVIFSHEGVLFLLGNMGIQLPKQKIWGERERHFVGIRGKNPSLPLSPPRFSTAPCSPPIENMATLPSHSHNIMASVLPHRPLRPDKPFFRSAPLSPTSYTQQKQQERAPTFLDLTQRVLPFDFSASTQPGLTLPKDLKAFYFPPEQITMTKNRVPPPPNPLRKHSSNPIFFTDPALREDVAELFGHTLRSENSNHGNVSQTRSCALDFHTTARQTLPYHANADDVLVWIRRLEGGEDNQAGDCEVKSANWAMIAWPPWNFRFDLEL